MSPTGVPQIDCPSELHKAIKQPKILAWLISGTTAEKMTEVALHVLRSGVEIWEVQRLARSHWGLSGVDK